MSVRDRRRLRRALRAAKAAGADIVDALETKTTAGLVTAAATSKGHLWWFGQLRPMGAEVAVTLLYPLSRRRERVLGLASIYLRYIVRPLLTIHRSTSNALPPLFGHHHHRCDGETHPSTSRPRRFRNFGSDDELGGPSVVATAATLRPHVRHRSQADPARAPSPEQPRHGYQLIRTIEEMSAAATRLALARCIRR